MRFDVTPHELPPFFVVAVRLCLVSLLEVTLVPTRTQTIAPPPV